MAKSRKGNERVIEEAPKRRPTTRSAAQKLMADVLKANACSTTAVRRARTFKISNFKIPDVIVVELSGEEVENKIRKRGQKRKRKWLQRRLITHSQKGRDLSKRESGHRDLVPRPGKLRVST